MGLLRKGLIDTLPEDPKAAYIRDMMDKENPRMDPAIRSDFDDPTLENLKEAATELGYLNENMPKGVSDYDMLRSFQKDELLNDLGDIIAKYVKDPDDIDRELDRFDIGGFDNMSNMVKANLGRDPEYKALAKKFNLNEGDTYEKMAAKGKKRGNLKQGTVRKRLKIKDGEKIPLSKINKAISKIKKMENPSEKNKKFLKALNLAKTLKTTTNVNE